MNCLVYPLGVEASNVAFAAAEGTSDAPRPPSLAAEVTDTRRRTALGWSGRDARNEAAGDLPARVTSDAGPRPELRRVARSPRIARRFADAPP